jgi:hypothetical protein
MLNEKQKIMELLEHDDNIACLLLKNASSLRAEKPLSMLYSRTVPSTAEYQ